MDARRRPLGRPTLEALDTLPPERRPAISSISLWEVATLVERRRLILPQPLEAWFDAAADARTVQIVSITPAIAAEVARLPAGFHRDPADRLIVATCRVMGYPLNTNDLAIARARLARRWTPTPSTRGPRR